MMGVIMGNAEEFLKRQTKKIGEKIKEKMDERAEYNAAYKKEFKKAKLKAVKIKAREDAKNIMPFSQQLKKISENVEKNSRDWR
jgi:hypothetical protein